MQQKTYLVITSISADSNEVLRQYAGQSRKHGVEFILIGDSKSPRDFNLPSCNFYDLDRQKETGFHLAELLPTGHYARKNLGYLLSARSGAEAIIETDDDNIPYESFWEERKRVQDARLVNSPGWINIYRAFTDQEIWPRGLPLAEIKGNSSYEELIRVVEAPIQQGLADDNPDVDAIYRLTKPLPVRFNHKQPIALSAGAIGPFNSQNTTWFREAFTLMYLPSFCSFRMTDIWRSFIAQRIAWTCGWKILFHSPTVRQERNVHDLMKDLEDEIPGYLHNAAIMEHLIYLNLDRGIENILPNLRNCYTSLIEAGFMDLRELPLVEAWIEDIKSFNPE